MTKVIIVCRNEDPNDPNPMKPITINTIPGKPQNLQSFLFPFFAELVCLEEGIYCGMDTRRSSLSSEPTFSFSSGDMPAAQELNFRRLQFKARLQTRLDPLSVARQHCSLPPTTIGEDDERRNYDPLDLPKKTQEEMELGYCELAEKVALANLQNAIECLLRKANGIKALQELSHSDNDWRPRAQIRLWMKSKRDSCLSDQP